MDSQAMLQSTYLDVIFEGRNKAYGSYILRQTYGQRMRRAGGFMMILCTLILGYALWPSRVKNQVSSALTVDIKTADTILISHIEFDLPNKALPDRSSGAANPVKTASFTDPQVVRDVALKLDQNLASKDDLKDAVAGLQTQEGVIGANGHTQTGNGGGGSGGQGGGECQDCDANTVYNVVEENPEFPGGKDALYAYLAEHVQYPAAALSAGKEGKVLVKFVVNEDGSVAQVTVLRGFGYGSEYEAERVISGMPRWRPGRNNNKPVKVWFQVPIFFKLN